MEKKSQTIIREPAEIKYSKELQVLKENDKGNKKPENWNLSLKNIIKFILGTDDPIEIGKKSVPITKKFYGDEILIQRAVASLASDRALMLVGEPGTAKSFLSELLTSAISGTSINTIQGSASVTEDQIKYSWNYALLIANGPSRDSLVPAPVLTCIEEGRIVRFEEITRCSPEIQDLLLSILSDKVLFIPELGDEGIKYAKSGFGLIATANTRDKGVNEMSSALKRRMNFETVNPLTDVELEMELVTNQVDAYLERSSIQREVTQDVIEMLTTTFSELRSGATVDNEPIERLPSITMSTAECVDTSINSAIYSHYLENSNMSPKSAVSSLKGTIIKDNIEDLTKLRNYFELIIKRRSGKNWKQFYQASKSIF